MSALSSSSSLIPLASSVFVILCAGFPLTFSLYATSFQSVLGLTQTQINAINIANIVGQFLGYPLIGFLSDKYGANVVAAFGAVFSVPSLLVAAATYEKRGHYLVLATCFFGVGVGSTCGYITSISVCGRAVRDAKGLAMSVPICAYGLATLVFSLVFQTFFSDRGGEYDIPGFWRTITVFVGASSVVAYFGMKLPRPIKESTVETTTDTDESAPLLQHDSDDASTSGSVDQTPPTFFRDFTVLLFAAGYILIAGSTETLVGNMGSLSQSISSATSTTTHAPPSLLFLLSAPPSSSVDTAGASGASTSVSIFALCSTLARLAIGFSSDLLAKTNHSRMLIPLLAVGVPMTLVFLALGAAPMTPVRFLAVVGVNGWCYGAMYCCLPTIAAVVWGLDHFGRNWVRPPPSSSSSSEIFFLLNH